MRHACGESIAKIGADPDMPCAATIYNWENDHPKFLEMFSRARKAYAHHLAHEALEIADKTDGDVIIDQNGVERIQHEVVNRSRLRVETRRWWAGCMNREVYGTQRIESDNKNHHTGEISVLMQQINASGTRTQDRIKDSDE